MSEWGPRRARYWGFALHGKLISISVQGFVFKFDLKAGFPCFGTKLCHIKAAIKACKKRKEKERKKWALASHQQPVSTSLGNISSWRFSTEVEISVIHVAIRCCPEARCGIDPHNTALCQHSKNSKQTHNNGRITEDLKARGRKIKGESA